MVSYLILASIIIFACILCDKISSKLGLPMLLLFILLGMMFGVDGIFHLEYNNYDLSEQVCSIALIFIMFYGGFGTRLKEARSVMAQAVLLSSVGSILTAFSVGFFAHLVLKIPAIESLLIGSVICSTDAASVFGILRAKRLNLKYNTASMLEVESGSNDPFSYMLTTLCLKAMGDGISLSSIGVMFLLQILIGLLFGVLIGLLAIYLLTKTNLISSTFTAVFIVGVAIISYAITTYSKGNGFLAVYISGLILGNSQIQKKQILSHFFDTATTFMQIVLFFLLGLLATPSKLPAVALNGLLIALFVTFIARPLAVILILTPFKAPIKQQFIVAWSGLRGAASIVFAILVILSKVPLGEDIFHLVFFIVLLSILIQGSLIPFFSRRFGMIDKDFDVMKTFTDYVDDSPINYIGFKLTDNHTWINKTIREIILPPQCLLLLIIRGNERIIPKGNTVLLEGDYLILSGAGAEEKLDINLYEKLLKENDKLVGKTLKEINNSNILIIMIKRKNITFLPNGNTRLLKDDKIVVCNKDSLLS